MALRIPTSEYSKIVKLAKLDDALVQSLKFALQNSAPQFGPKDLIKSLPNNIGLTEPVLTDIVGLLLNLYWIREENESEPAAVARDVVESSRMIVDIRGNLSDSEFEILETRLAALLSIDGCLVVTAKARFVANQAERIFGSAKVFTDARPIYSRNPGDAPAAFVITHTLQIDVLENGKERAWFASLDSDDLKTLKRSIDRAIDKEASLRSALEKTKIPTLSEATGAS